MRASRNKLSNSDTYALIRQLPMASDRRARALSAMRDGEAIADGIVWVLSGLKHLFGSAALKPSLTR